MNDADFVDDDIPQDSILQDTISLDTPWFLTEASAFIGARTRRDPLLSRVAARMRRRVRPEQLISGSIFGLVRHAATAAIYLGLAYAAKLVFGVSLVFNAVR